VESLWQWAAMGGGSLLLGGFTFWLNRQDSRLTELEKKVAASDERLARIETKLDILLMFKGRDNGPDDLSSS
jgi:hypothetical protein